MDGILRVHVQETASTNDLAKAYAREHGDARAVFSADRQSAGRGRMGRSFVSDEGGLYVSFLCRPRVPMAEAVRLTVYAAAVTACVLERLTGHAVQIKWVNDLYMKGRKIAGILTEGALAEDGVHAAYAVVGIGINLSHVAFDGELSQIATSVEEACGVRLGPTEVREALTEAFFENDATDGRWIDEYRRRSFLIGKDVTAQRGEESFPCHVLGVTDGGALRVRCAGGEIRELSSGEVRVRPTTDAP